MVEAGVWYSFLSTRKDCWTEQWLTALTCCMDGPFCTTAGKLPNHRMVCRLHFLSGAFPLNFALVNVFVSLFSEYLNSQDKSLSTLTLITVDREQLTSQIVKSIFHHLSPECTISALHFPMKSFGEEEIPEIVPIGRCFLGRQAALLDSYGLQIIPDGRSVGELS